MPHRTRRFSPLASATRRKLQTTRVFPSRGPAHTERRGDAVSGQEDWLGGSSARSMAGVLVAGLPPPVLLLLVWPSRLRAICRPATPDDSAWARASDRP